MPDISVIVCTHNPRADYLELVLNSLKAQTISPEKWELLLVDNGSAEPLSKTWDISWQPNAFHIREETLGLTHARFRGIREASGDLLIFVDDDNVLDPHYLEIALNLAAEWPRIGVFGGSQVPAFEQPPNDEIKDHLGWLALRTIRRATWTNIKGTWDATPFGAGLCIRRAPALRYVQAAQENPLKRMLGRSGKNGLLSGEDLDIAWSVCDWDYGTMVTPTLVVIHHIHQKRLNKAYILQITEGTAASEILLRKIHQLPLEMPGRIRRLRRRLWVQFNKKGMEREVAFAELRGRARGRKILENLPEPVVAS